MNKIIQKIEKKIINHGMKQPTPLGLNDKTE